MGFAGLIYAAIVVAWASFLVPMALRRHDQASRTRSVEHFSTAMRVLAHSDPDARTGSSVARSTLRPTRAAQAQAASRRRRVLLVLVALTAVAGGLSLGSLLPWWVFVLPLLATVGFLCLARRQVRLANESYWVEAARATPETSHVIPRIAARVDASHGIARAQVEADDEPTVTLTPEQIAQAAAGLAEERVVAVAMTTADGQSLWDPLPVTLPTYVDKPVAKRTIRTVALAGADTWSAGHDTAASQAVAAAEDSRHDVEEPARVVNG